jgi:hypothetical protein
LQPMVKILATIILCLSSLPLVWGPARNLEYEYALITSWLLVVGLPLLGCLWPKRLSYLQFRRPEVPLTFMHFFVFIWLPFISFIPGLILFRSGMCGCGGMGYAGWMSLLVLPAAWLGMGGFLYAIDLHRPASRRWLVVIVPMLWALAGALAMWFFPQKRAINAVFGFLHGPVYDSWIPIDAGIVWARISHGTLGVLLVGVALRFFEPQRLKYVFVNFRSDRRNLLFGILVAFFVGAQIISCTYSSIWHGTWFLNRALPQVIYEKNIELHYLKNSAATENHARRLARDAAFHVAEIQEIMGVQLIKPVLIYAYSSADQKKLLFGGGSTDVTDVWTPSVHIELEGSPHPTLRHELVHAVASFVSWHGIGFHPNMLVTEGLAVALAPVDEALEFDEISASMIKSGRVGSLEALVSPFGFWAASGSRSYVVAGSLLRWLGKNYGTESIRAIYRGGSIDDVTKMELSKVLDLWSEDIAKKHSENNALVVEHFSRDPGVFGAQCPHTSEDLARNGADSLWTRLRQPMGWSPNLLPLWQLGLDPLDRAARMVVERGEIKLLMQAPILNQEKVGAWLLSQDEKSVWPPGVMEDLDSALLRSDVERVTGLKEASEKRLADLLKIFSKKNPGRNLRRQVDVRLELSRLPLDQNSAQWWRYLAGWGPIPEAGKDPAWIYSYLRSRRVLVPTKEQLGLWKSQLGEAKVYPEIYREWTRLLAATYAASDAWSEARDLYKALAELSSGESKILANEHVRRMNYFLNAKPSQ